MQEHTSQIKTVIRTIASTEDAVEINQFVSAMKHMLITLQLEKTKDFVFIKENHN